MRGTFVLLEILSGTCAVVAVAQGNRPLFWLAGWLASMATFFLLTSLKRQNGRPIPGFIVTVIAPALVFVMLSFMVIPDGVRPPATTSPQSEPTPQSDH